MTRPRAHPVWKENPAWLNRALARNLEHVQTVAPASWMPAFAHARTFGKKADVVVDFQEFGCGNYGCVLPTRDPRIVMKITTDRSEVDFVIMAMAWGWPAGITEYVGVLPLEGEYKLSSKFPAGPAAVLWREGASQVGKMDAVSSSADARLGGARIRQQAVLLWDRIYDSGATAYKFLTDEGDDAQILYAAALERRAQGAKLAAEAIRYAEGDEIYIQDVVDAADASEALQLAAVIEVYRQTARELEANAAGRALGQTLLFYLEQHGILMGDLHRGNVGLVERPSSGPAWAITDPGNIAVLGSSWR